MSALWYPYSKPDFEPSLTISSADNAYVFDDNGRSYLNACGGLWNVTLGLNNQYIISRIQEQLKKMAYASLFGVGHQPAHQLAERLIALTDNEMSKVYLSMSGSSAVEVAIRAARLSQSLHINSSKKYVLSFDRAYHGSSFLNLSASGIKQKDFEQYESRHADFITVSSPLDENRSLADLSEVLEQQEDSIACLIMEPILGSGGIIEPSLAYCKEINHLCRKHQVYLIADEVATAGGRCGAFLASKLLGLNPDIICLSKAINSGYYPLGATLFKSHVYEPINQNNVALLYGSTQDGNPVACAAAMATLDYVDEHQLTQRSLILGKRIRDELTSLTENTVLHSIRGKGLMIGLKLNHLDGKDFTAAEAYQVRMKCQEEGLLVYNFDSGLSLFPPMTINDDELIDIVDILKDVLSTYI